MLLYDTLQLYCTHSLLYCFAVLCLYHRNISVFVQGAESDLFYRFYMLFFSPFTSLDSKAFFRKCFHNFISPSQYFPSYFSTKETDEQRG